MSLFHVQMQQPQEHLSFLQNLLNFFITKYLRQEVNNDLSVYVDEFSSCVDLSVSHDQKVMTLLPPNLITRDKENFQSHVIMRL